MNEDTELSLNANVPVYDKSKAEGVLRIREGLKRGLDAVMLHPVGVLGPGDHRPSHIGGVILKMSQRRLPAVVDGGFTWCDVRDVASTALSAEKAGRKGENYILGGEWLSIAELGAMVSRIAHVPPPRICLPFWLAFGIAPIVGALSWLTRIPSEYNPAAMHALRNHRLITHAKAERELGHRPRPIEDAVADTISWFRDNGYFK